MHTHVVGHSAMTMESLAARVSPLHLCEFVVIVMPNRGKGGGKLAEDEEPTGADRRLPREPLGPYDRPCPIDGDPWSRRMWAQDLRKGKSKGRIPAGLLEIMQDQLPMLTEKGLRELLVSISCELSFRGDVREQNEEVQLEYEANGGKGSAFPPDSVIEMWRSLESRIESKGAGRGSKGAGRGGDARGVKADDEEEDFVEEEVEYRIPPGEGDRYWDEHGVEHFYD